MQEELVEITNPSLALPLEEREFNTLPF